MDEIGPVDYAVIAFPGNQFRGEIAPAIADLVEAGTIRIIDAAFVSKDENGDVYSFELTELDPTVRASLDSLNVEVQGLVNEAELEQIGQELDLETSAALLVWENVWARRVAQTMRDAGGTMVAFERVPHALVRAAREWALDEANA